MKEIPISTPFDLTGRFGGFVFTETGKRRLLLQTDSQEYVLKVPRILRRRIIGKFRVGEPIRVAGTEELDSVTQLIKRFVSQVLLSSTDAPSPGALPPAIVVAAGPIRVCSKKNCWRQGGRELWEALGQEIVRRGLTDQIERRQVGCLDRCKQAPNADWGKEEYTRCHPQNVSAIIARMVPLLPADSVQNQ